MNTDTIAIIAKYLPVRLIDKVFSPKLALTIYCALTDRTANELLRTNLTLAEHVIEILALTNSRFDPGFDQLVPKIVTKQANIDPVELLSYNSYRLDDSILQWYSGAINNINFTALSSSILKEDEIVQNLIRFKPNIFHQLLTADVIHSIMVVDCCLAGDKVGLNKIYQLAPEMVFTCNYDLIPEITNYILQKAYTTEDIYILSSYNNLLCHLAAQQRFDLLEPLYDKEFDWSEISATLMATDYWGPRLSEFLAKDSTRGHSSSVYFVIDYNDSCPYQLKPSIPSNWQELLELKSSIVAPALVLFAGMLDRDDVLAAAISHVNTDFLYEALLFFTTNMFSLAFVQQLLPKDEIYSFNVNNGKVLKINMDTMHYLVKKYKPYFNQIPNNFDFSVVDFDKDTLKHNEFVSMLNKLAFTPTVDLALAQKIIDILIFRANSSRYARKQKQRQKIPTSIHTDLWLQRKSIRLLVPDDVV